MEIISHNLSPDQVGYEMYFLLALLNRLLFIHILLISKHVLFVIVNRPTINDMLSSLLHERELVKSKHFTSL